MRLHAPSDPTRTRFLDGREEAHSLTHSYAIPKTTATMHRELQLRESVPSSFQDDGNFFINMPVILHGLEELFYENQTEHNKQTQQTQQNTFKPISSRSSSTPQAPNLNQ